MGIKFGLFKKGITATLVASLLISNSAMRSSAGTIALSEAGNRTQPGGSALVALNLSGQIHTLPDVNASMGLKIKPEDAVIHHLDPKVLAFLERAGQAGLGRVSLATKQTSSGRHLETLTQVKEALNPFKVADIQQMPLETLDDIARQIWESQEAVQRVAATPTADLVSLTLAYPTENGSASLSTPHRNLPAPNSLTQSVPNFIPAKELPYSRVSIRRAWGHVWFRWRRNRVFQIPLISSDHWVLFWMSMLAIYTWGVALNHLTEALDGKSVVNNAKRYQKNPTDVAWDEDLIRVIRKFENETGWNVAWTDDPYLLAQADPEAKKVVLSLGWVVRSPRRKDRRRLAYLTDTLRHIRQAIP